MTARTKLFSAPANVSVTPQPCRARVKRGFRTFPTSSRYLLGFRDRHAVNLRGIQAKLECRFWAVQNSRAPLLKQSGPEAQLARYLGRGGVVLEFRAHTLQQPNFFLRPRRQSSSIPKTPISLSLGIPDFQAKVASGPPKSLLFPRIVL